MTLRRLDLLAAGLLCLAALLIFGLGAPRLGFYADDAAWLSTLPSAPDPWAAMRGYMPGRHLHPLWHWLAYRLIGDPLRRLPALHLLQSLLDGVLAALFYLLLRRLDLSAAASFLAAAAFAFWPLHGETHFWLESLPMNLVSTLFALLFAWTTLSLDRPRPGLLVLDLLAFLCAVFTYDQVLLPLLVLIAFRPRLILYRLPHLAAAGFCIWLRLTQGGGPLPQLDLGAIVANIRYTIESHAGRAGFHAVAPLFGASTLTDRLLALLVAAAIAAGAIYLLHIPSPTRQSTRLPIAAAALLVAAWSPVWLWHLSPRHHYLPSIPLFVLLAWALDRLRHPAFCLLVALGVFAGACAARGESRHWEASFAAKHRLFAELAPYLAGRHTLVLSGFPLRLGPAPLISPHDSVLTPRLLLGLPPGFRGHLGYVPVPGGRFLATHFFDGADAFYYSSDPGVLVVRFTSWDRDRLGFELDPSPPLPQPVCAPASSAFSVRHLSARLDHRDLLLSLDFTSGSRLSAVVRFPHGGRWDTWGVRDADHYLNIQPILLSEPGRSCSQTLRLPSFPHVDRIRVDFYETPPGRSAVPLRQVELPLRP